MDNKGKSKISGVRSRRERQAQARCSNSSADEDQGDLHLPVSAAAPPPGTSYSSDETLKAYECEAKGTMRSVRFPPDDDYAEATDCTLTDVTPNEDTDQCCYHDNRASFFSNASEGDVESDGDGISSEQLLKVVDNYLKNKPWDTHSNDSAHSIGSSRSSLTLTETEQEGRDSSDQHETGVNIFTNNSTLPSTNKTANLPRPANSLPVSHSSRSSGATSSLPRFDPPPPPLPERNLPVLSTSVPSPVLPPPVVVPAAPVLATSATPNTYTMGLPQTDHRTYQSIQSLQGQPRNTMQQEERYFPLPSVRSSQVDYPSATMATTTVALPPFTRALHNDIRPSAKIQQVKRSKKKQSKLQKVCGFCHWKCLAVVFMFITLLLAATVAYFIAVRALDVNWKFDEQPIGDGDYGVFEDTTESSVTTNLFTTGKPIEKMSPTVSPVFLTGQSVQKLVPPGKYFRTILYIKTAKYVEFNLSVPNDSQLVMYGKKGDEPTHTKFDFMQVFEKSLNRDYENEQERQTRSGEQVYDPIPETLRFQFQNRKDLRKRDLTEGIRETIESKLFLNSRRRRSTSTTVNSEIFTHYMLPGHWYLAVFNDGSTPQQIILNANNYVAPTTETDAECPNGCHGNGRCVDSKCDCYPAYTGDDCSLGVCPVLCFGRGIYDGGVCQCEPEWKGPECTVPNYECIIPDCNGHGECIDGVCLCEQRFKGEFCELVDCLDPSCSGHGVCFEGQCHCGHGWMGDSCDKPVPVEVIETTVCPSLPIEDTEVGETLDTDRVCHGRGYYDNSIGRCICDDDWGGRDCSHSICDEDSDCGPNQECQMSSCVCMEGWTGSECQTQKCKVPCSIHGLCIDTVCRCDPGWNGWLCSNEGCPNSCNGQGECTLVNDDWQCVCNAQWKGHDCSIGIEDRCNDRKDNDLDNLVDCQDPDCCSAMNCISDGLCKSVPDPSSLIKLRDDVPPNAPFYDHVSFLTEPSSVQLSSMPFAFTESMYRVSVVRGRVVTTDGSPLIGVTVRIKDLPLFGFTYSRIDGMFDLIVRGGGSVTVQFSRDPFETSYQSVFVPWNDFVVVDDVTMSTYFGNRDLQPCGKTLQKPDVVFLSETSSEKGSCLSAVLADIQAVHEEIRIPDTPISLVYHSNKAPGYQTLLHLQLTPPQFVEKLSRVHLRITVQGRVFSKIFIAHPDLRYTYGWDKFNVYGEKSYGIVMATVSVGYEYDGCGYILWDRKMAELAGYDIVTTAMAGWRINLHHGFNVWKGSVNNGDGTDIRVPKDKPPLIMSVMGNGKSRDIECSNCEGKAKGNKVLAPVAVASSPDGSLFVGDYNFIRKIQPNGNATNILKMHYLPTHKYYLAVSPLDNSVYMADSQTRQILKLRYLVPPIDVNDNIELIAGTGAQCLPLDNNQCGDGRQAREAKLIGPKGLTISSDGSIYFIDGSVIRMINTDGIISTYMGSHDTIDSPRPFRCQGTMTFDEVQLEWPIDIAVNPVDGSLHVLDNNIILKLTPDKKVSIVAGKPVHCISYFNQSRSVIEEFSIFDQSDALLARGDFLSKALAIAFSPTGELYVTETNSRFINRVRKITTDGRIVLFAGGVSQCDCSTEDCDCFIGDEIVAKHSMLHIPTAITVAPDNTLYIADQGNLRIRSVSPNMPQPRHGKQYDVESPIRQEMYVFNNDGKHIMTRDVVTDEIELNFTYTDNNELKNIIATAGGIFKINRDINGIATSFTSPDNDRYEVIMNSDGYLQSVLTTSGKIMSTFSYHGDSGLLATRKDGNILTKVYRYDQYGRLDSIGYSNGDVTQLESAISLEGASTKITPSNRIKVKLMSEVMPWITRFQEKRADQIMNITLSPNGSTLVTYPNGVEVELESETYPTMEETSPVLTKRKITLPSGNVHRLEWRFYVRRGGRKSKRTVQVVGRRLRINGINALTLEYNRYTKTETLHDADNEPQLIISHDSQGLPTEWQPSNGMKSVFVDYNQQGRVSSWRNGVLYMIVEYDNDGRVSAKHYSGGSEIRFMYIAGKKPTTVILPLGQEYHLSYKSGQLSSVTSPSKTTYSLDRLALVGNYRNIFFINDTQWLIEDRLNTGAISKILYPGNKRRVTYLYNNQGMKSVMLHDEVVVKFDYYRFEGQIKSIEMKDSYLKNVLRYKYHGPLPKEQTMRFNEDGFIGVEYRYSYDNNFKIASVQSDFDGHSSLFCNYTYHIEKGHPVQYCNYTVIQMEWFAVVLAHGESTITKQFDQYGRLIIYQLQIKNEEVYKMIVKYNNISYISESQLNTLNDQVKLNFLYDQNGQILEVNAGNWLSWQYSYDNNGNLVNLKYNDDNQFLHYDSRDRIIQFVDTAYKIDDDGFLIQRGQETFRYDSKGNLVHALKVGGNEVWYHYDGLNRRVVQADNRGNRVQYFYGDIEYPNRVTNIYDKSSRELLTLIYDLQGFLMAIRDGSRQYYVATDQSGSPVAVFNNRGELLKQVVYSPYGEIIQNTAPNFKLHLGFRGGIHDEFTGFVHFPEGDYDPVIGRWINPQFDAMWRWATQTNKHPALNVYIYNGNNPVNDNIGEFQFMTDLKNWLPVLGFSLTTMVPHTDKNGEITRNYQQWGKSTNDVCNSQFTSTVECIASNLMDSLNNHLYSLPTMQLFDDPVIDRIETRTSEDGIGSSIFKDHVIMSIEDGRVVTRLLDDSNENLANLAKVLNGSEMLDRTKYNIHGKESVYFVKGRNTVGYDLRVIGATTDTNTRPLIERIDLTDDLTVTIHTIYPGHTNKFSNIDIRIHSTYLVLNIRYGATPAEDQDRVRRHVKQRAILDAWNRERDLLLQGRVGSRMWTEDERNSVIQNRYVDGYDGYYAQDIDKYPELIDDCNSIRLLTYQEGDELTASQLSGEM
ncbi:teneurin-3-like [Saccoglossus kowalevskii]|uniref:Teneurin-3-like n=1 Tax=Saccoglossus kowalevskii TaxID=10224 RepID=A0ABM0M6F9_SACKO|nr:PREDICTED: teneurin-3-like [Saccoglossus kowalevskii]